MVSYHQPKQMSEENLSLVDDGKLLGLQRNEEQTLVWWCDNTNPDTEIEIEIEDDRIKILCDEYDDEEDDDEEELGADELQRIIDMVNKDPQHEQKGEKIPSVLVEKGKGWTPRSKG